MYFAARTDYENYAARTLKSDLRLWVGKPDWIKVLSVLRVSRQPILALYGFSPNGVQQTFELLLFPNVLWALLINGLTIGVNIAISTTYSLYKDLNVLAFTELPRTSDIQSNEC